jgi:hypothetical protein
MNYSKITLIALLLQHSSSFAGWVQVSRLEDKDATFYIDPGRIKKEGVIRRAWGVMDLGPANKMGKGSVVSLYELNCKKEMSRVVTSSAYSGLKGEGDLLASEKGGDWEYVAPETIQESIMKYVCKTKPH